MGNRLDGFERNTKWDRKWYGGVIMKEYEVQGMNEPFMTQDRATKKAGTRQVQVCIALLNGSDVRNFNVGVYYKPDVLFNDERLAELKEMAKQRGRWADTHAQADFIKLQELNELAKACGLSLDPVIDPETGEQSLNVGALIGKQVDAFYSIYHKDASGRYEQLDADTLKGLDDGTVESQKGWFGGISKLAPFGTKSEVKAKVAKGELVSA